jgi:ectoine hydroxylase-related dioxygenase (phytanoyl-CoA dioxygenase family)
MRSTWQILATAGATRAAALLQEHGVCLVEGAAESEIIAALRRELAPHFDVISLESARNRTRRIHSRVLATSPSYGALVVHPLVRETCAAILGPNCVRDQLSSVQGIEVWPGATDQELHRDDAIFRLKRPRPEMELNAMWAIDDFTIENGATRVVMGSHLWDDARKPTPEDTVLAAEMPAGSVLLWLGSTWHGAGANRSARPRRGAYVGYSLGWLRQEETLYLALPPATARGLPEELQRLIGYELKGTMTLGWLDGGDPRRALENA